MMKFFTASFWFDAKPLPFNHTAFWVFTVLFLLALALGFFSYWQIKKQAKDKIAVSYLVKLMHFGYTFGLVGLLLVFLKQQRIIYLGMRFWLALFVLICLVWLAFILKYILKEVPKFRQAKAEKARMQKYLP